MLWYWCHNLALYMELVLNWAKYCIYVAIHFTHRTAHFSAKTNKQKQKKMEIHRNETGWFWFFMLNFSIWKKKIERKVSKCRNSRIHRDSNGFPFGKIAKQTSKSQISERKSLNMSILSFKMPQVVKCASINKFDCKISSQTDVFTPNEWARKVLWI